MKRPHIIIHTVASVDGRVSLGPDRTGFDDVGDERWQAIWASGTSLEESVRDLISLHDPDVLLEGSGSFVREGEELQPLPPSEYPLGELREDYLPEKVIRRPGQRGWLTVVDGRGRLRSGMKEFPGWEGWHTLHLVCDASPSEYLAFLRRREIPYLMAGRRHVDLVDAMGRLTAVLGVERVVCTAGSRLNGALLRGGLVDELSLVLLPALIGGSETPTLFRSPDLGPEEWPARLKLVSVDAEPTGRVRLHYHLRKAGNGMQRRNESAC